MRGWPKTLPLSAACLVLVLAAWALSWRMDDQRDHPGWQWQSVRVLAAEWRTLGRADRMRVVYRDGTVEDCPIGAKAAGWEGWRPLEDGGSPESDVRFEISQVAWADLLGQDGEVWACPGYADLPICV